MASGNTNRGWKRLVNAFRFSMQGLKAAYRGEEAFRQELAVLLIATPLAIWLGETGVEVVLLIGSIVLVLVVELLNSAIEAVVDRFGGEWHELSGRAKDMGSAAVLLISVNAVLTWLVILLP
ncbi:MAG: diacylglycerol kinase [Proteobacteria bacterium]|nr:MAG: diacylglycerol kinase [Pseudomonadota bacterium]